MPRSGNFADVYEVRSPGGRWAVKCFTARFPICANVTSRSAALFAWRGLPFAVDFRYLEKDSGCRPLEAYPQDGVGRRVDAEPVRRASPRPAGRAGALLQIWAHMAGRLRAANIAHCDLQHGNVLLVPGHSAHSLALKLIDYDGMWVPSLANTKSGEVGHPSYQHPQRLREGRTAQRWTASPSCWSPRRFAP